MTRLRTKNVFLKMYVVKICLPTPKNIGHTNIAASSPKLGTKKGNMQARNANSSVNGAYNSTRRHNRQNKAIAI